MGYADGPDERTLPMTRRLLLSFVASIPTVACSSASSGTGNSPSPAPSGSQSKPETLDVCEATPGTCADLKDRLPSEVRRDRSGALVSLTGHDHEDITIYADGTARKSAQASTRYRDWYWNLGDIVAKLSAESMRRVKTALAQAQQTDVAHPFLGADFAKARQWNAPFADVITFEDGRQSCVGPHAAISPPYFCGVAQAIDPLRTVLSELDAACQAKWDAAQEGTVTLVGKEIFPRPWPLAPELAVDGVHTISLADYDLLDPSPTVGAITLPDTGGVWTLPDGRYVHTGRGKATYGGGRVEYQVWVTSFGTAAEPTDARVRAALLATKGKLGFNDYRGFHADRTVFPIFKGKRIVILPATADDPSHTWQVAAFERLDVTGEGEI